jgi:putative ABC transport system permease protein
VSIVVISSSVERSVEGSARALAGPAPLRVVGPVERGGVGRDALTNIRATTGVAAAIPVVQAITLVDPGDGDEITVTALGFDCSIEALVGPFSCDPDSLTRLTTPLLPPSLHDDLRPGATLRTSVGRTDLDGALTVDQLAPLNGGQVVALALPEAQRVFGRGSSVDVVFILPEPGSSVATVQAELRAALGDDFGVLGSLDAPPIVGVILSTFLPIFSVIALLALGIGAVLVRNSITLSLEERRRQTAIVGALGGSRRLLLWGTVAEVTVLGLVGGLLGVAGGVAIAHPVAAGLTNVTKSAGIPLRIHPTASAFVVGIGVSVVVAVVSAVGPARRATRLDVAAELASRDNREEAIRAVSWRRILLAAAAMFGGVGICYLGQLNGGLEPVQAKVAPLGFVATVIPGVYLVAGLVPRLIGVIERRREWTRSSTRLAFANLRREPRRTGVMGVALGFAVAVGFITASFNRSVATSIEESFRDHATAVEVASSDDVQSTVLEARLSRALLRRLAELPGAGVVERGDRVVVGHESGDLIGVSAFSDPWLNAPVAQGKVDREALDTGSVIIGTGLARSEGIRPGDRLALDTPHGQVSLPVMAVVLDGDFGGRNVQMSYAKLEELFGRQAPLVVYVEPEPWADATTLAETIRKADLDPALVVRTPDQSLRRVQDAVKKQLSAFGAVQRGLLAMSFIAVLSTLLLVGIQRRREFGMLAAVGMTPGEIARMVLTEAGLVAIVAAVVACIGGLVQYASLLLVTPVFIGFQDPFVVDVGSVVTYALLGVVVALLAAVYPSVRAARVEVLEALRYE